MTESFTLCPEFVNKYRKVGNVNILDGDQTRRRGRRVFGREEKCTQPRLKKKNNNKKAERQCSAETQPTLEGGGGATKIIN